MSDFPQEASSLCTTFCAEELYCGGDTTLRPTLARYALFTEVPHCPGRYQPLYPDQDHLWTNNLVTKAVVRPPAAPCP